MKKGIFLGASTAGSIIGGTEPNSGNIIAFNAENGIALSSNAGNGNLIDPNRIFNNGGLGIDIGEDGHTPNDLHDADTGANNLQNYPEIVSKQIVNNELLVSFKVDSAPTNSNYGADGIYVEFFKADSSGEGEKFLGFAFYTLADYNNGSPLQKTVNLGNINTLGISANDPLTATASDALNNTSEFAPPPLAPTAATVTIGGRVLTTTGSGISNARISLTESTGETRTILTNSSGFYQFNDVQAGRTYILSVSHKRYQFMPPTRVLFVNEDLTELNFTSSAE